MPVDYTCQPGPRRLVEQLAVSLEQNPHPDPNRPPEQQRLALGHGTVRDVVCDGNQHHVDVEVAISTDAPNTLGNFKDGQVDVLAVVSTEDDNRNPTRGTGAVEIRNLATYRGSGTIVSGDSNADKVQAGRKQQISPFEVNFCKRATLLKPAKAAANSVCQEAAKQGLL